MIAKRLWFIVEGRAVRLVRIPLLGFYVMDLIRSFLGRLFMGNHSIKRPLAQSRYAVILQDLQIGEFIIQVP